MWQYNNTNELYHYGKLGMKWGRRTGSRISTGVHNVNQKFQGTRLVKKVNQTQQNVKQKTDTLSPKTKRNLKIGAAVVGTGLAAYGAYKVSKMVKNNRAQKIAYDMVRESLKRQSADQSAAKFLADAMKNGAQKATYNMHGVNAGFDKTTGGSWRLYN